MPVATEIRRLIDDVMAGASYAVGSVSLNTGSTSTIVTRAGISTTSAIRLTAVSSQAANADIVRVVPASGSFTITHSSSTVGRTFYYAFNTPR